MGDEELRYRLAKLIVEALGTGSGKQETRVIQEIFDKLGATIPDSRKQFPSDLLRVAQSYPERVARGLANAAPTASDLINVVVSVGGRFIEMVQDVYTRLSRHAAQVAGAQAAERFRFQRGGVDEEQLTISPAFIERWRLLKEAAYQIDTGWIDEGNLIELLGWDMGFYGSPRVRPGERSVLAWVLALNRASAERGPEREAAMRVVTAAEDLVRTRIRRLQRLQDEGQDPGEANGAPANGPRDGRSVQAELALFRQAGVFGLAAFSGAVNGTDGTRIIGLRADMTPAAQLIPDLPARVSTPVEILAGFAAMWRLGLQPRSSGQPDPDRDLPADAAERQAWFQDYRTACDTAARQLSDEIFHVTGTEDVTGLVEAFAEFLNLPLWRQRELLYEIWVLCATLDACEQAGWTVTLNGLTPGDREWVLSVGRSGSPVATLRHAIEPAARLDVWREPSRKDGAQELTPDVTVATPPPYVQDLLVVEAKDRVKMSAGFGYRREKGRLTRQGSGAPSASPSDTPGDCGRGPSGSAIIATSGSGQAPTKTTGTSGRVCTWPAGSGPATFPPPSPNPCAPPCHRRRRAQARA
jgi:hypothetical protein